MVPQSRDGGRGADRQKNRVAILRVPVLRDAAHLADGFWRNLRYELQRDAVNGGDQHQQRAYLHVSGGGLLGHAVLSELGLVWEEYLGALGNHETNLVCLQQPLLADGTRDQEVHGEQQPAGESAQSYQRVPGRTVALLSRAHLRRVHDRAAPVHFRAAT